MIDDFAFLFDLLPVALVCFPIICIPLLIIVVAIIKTRENEPVSQTKLTLNRQKEIN